LKRRKFKIFKFAPVLSFPPFKMFKFAPYFACLNIETHFKRCHLWKITGHYIVPWGHTLLLYGKI